MSKQIDLDKIRLDGGTQMRAEIDYHTVEDYAHAYASGVDMPELTVFCDGSTNWLGDGFHRWHAAKKAGKKMVPCHVKQGSQRDAILFAAGVNDTHGLRRTPEDKRIAVRTLLSDEEWRKCSDKWIADHAKVSRPFVADQRKQLPKFTGCNVAPCEDGKAEKRKGQDGKVYTRRKPVVVPHVPPIDADEPPVKKTELAATSSKPVTVSREKDYGDFFNEEHEWVRIIADLVARMRKRHSKANIDKGRYVHELNTMANEIAEAIEEAEAVA